jgi:hypothetical protein
MRAGTGCEGHTHDKEAGKVTPASDVIRLYSSRRVLRGSTRKVNAHATVPTATAADAGVHAPREQAQGARATLTITKPERSLRPAT